MKLASLRNGSRDGQLLVVSRDLTRAVAVEWTGYVDSWKGQP